MIFVKIPRIILEGYTFFNLLCLMAQFYFDSRGSTVGMATGYGLDNQGIGVRVPTRTIIFTSSYCPDRLWRSDNLLPNGYRHSSPGGKAARA
jgi:hypothetical protein